MTAVADDETADRGIGSFDPITLEVLRSRLEAIAEDAASTIERTGVNPVITESHDFGVTLLDADGDLIAGGGWVAQSWVAVTRAVHATIERYGDTIAPGDVFFANDPYNGGGLHMNDVLVERPIFVGDRRVAWMAISAHMLDMGGMAVGSFAPAATDCFQEALRIPPARLFERGVEVTTLWEIIRANVRMAPLIEMDLRGLVAGAHVAQEKTAELAEALGVDEFVEGVEILQRLSEREFRARISAMADGVYRIETWNEWDDELYRVPCTLTVDGDHLIFDFDGASPQAPHYFNSQPYIIKSSFMMLLRPLLAPDLPFTAGLVAPVEVRCPEGTIVHAVPPAPINNGHVNVAQTAAEAALQCVRMALWASHPALPASSFVSGWGGSLAMANTTWAATDGRGQIAWALLDGAQVGGPGTLDHDGTDCASTPVGFESPATSADVEVMESWYPLLMIERSVRQGVNGAGEFRSGAGAQLAMRPHGTDRFVGQMLGIRAWLPVPGVAGGFPGSTTQLLVHRADGSVDRVSAMAADVVVEDGETFELRCPSSGGCGDPLDRDAAAVVDDVADGWYTTEDALAVYGVVVDGDGVVDQAATDARRAAIRADRLARAAAPVRPVGDDEARELGGGEVLPLSPGVVQRGTVAFAAASGTPLAIAPDRWTDGCALLEEPVPGPDPGLVQRAYLDPGTGATLHVEVVPAGASVSFQVLPARWTDAEQPRP
jgi:N-methylhydantoinase B